MKEYLLLLAGAVVILVSLVSKSESQLNMIIVWTRHGARGPMYEMQKNYYTWWTFNYEPTELTTVGQRQQLLLGAALRRNYRFFLPEYFNESRLIITSTESKRAVRSAQAFLMGLFPKAPKVKQQELEKLEYSLPPGYTDAEMVTQLKLMRNQKLPFNYQPFPLVAPISGTDPVMSPENSCPRVQEMREEAFKSQLYLDFEQDLWNIGFYDEFAKVYEEDLNFKGILTDTSMRNKQLNMTMIGYYFDSTYCDVFENLPLHEGMTEKLYKQMNFVYDIQNLWKNYPSEEAVKLMASKPARATLDHITNIISNSTYRNTVLYSGHDGNLITLLQFFGVMQPTFDYSIHENPTEEVVHTNPPFSSSVIFELYRDPLSYTFTVRLIYNGQPRRMTFCVNPYDCAYEDFRDYILANTYDDQEWEIKCQPTNPK